MIAVSGTPPPAGEFRAAGLACTAPGPFPALEQTMLRPVLALCAMFLTFASVASAANGEIRRPDRDDPRIPRDVERALRERYPRSRFAIYQPNEPNGVKLYAARVYGRGGMDASAQLTEYGDFVYAGFPDITPDQLPPAVKDMVFGLMAGEIMTVDRYESFSYQIDVEFGRGRAYRINMDGVGRVKDIVPMHRALRNDYMAFPRADRGEEETMRRALDELFPRMRVRSTHRHPEFPGYFYVNLSTPTEADVVVMANPQREVVETRFWLDQDLLPPPVESTLAALFPRARVTNVYQVRSITYNIIHPKGAANPVLTAVTPVGELVFVRPVNKGDRWRDLGEGTDQRPIGTFDPREPYRR
jgi:hypothetical protein